LRGRCEQILDRGRAGPDGQRGVVVRYPRSIDYFRRALARVDVDRCPDDPAAKLLAMARRILTPDDDAQPTVWRSRA
jgi:hypothetical protein